MKNLKLLDWCKYKVYKNYDHIYISFIQHLTICVTSFWYSFKKKSSNLIYAISFLLHVESLNGVYEV